MSSEVRVNMKPLAKYTHEVLETLRSTRRGGPIGRAFGVWVAMYRTFAQQRFARLSRGGGSWPPLKSGTVRTRRALWGYRPDTPSATAILDETGQMYRALFKGRRGAYEAAIVWGVVVGYGGSDRHLPRGPRRRVPRLTIAQIAWVHQVGSGSIPARPIIVIPPKRLLRRMAEIMERAIAKVGM